MIAEELISQLLPALKPADTADRARRWMHEYRTNQLPVVDQQTYLGLLSETPELEAATGKTPVANLSLGHENTYAFRHQHVYDVLKIALDHQLDVVPVVDEGREFVGTVRVGESLRTFAQVVGMREPGGILVLSLSNRDYSLAEISRLVESNDAKVISSYAAPDPDDLGKVRLTLKLNRPSVARVVATLERFNYAVIAQFQDGEVQSTDQERLDMLMKYINI